MTRVAYVPTLRSVGCPAAGAGRQGPAGSSVYGWRVVFFPSRVSTVRYGTVGGDGTAVITGMKNLGSGAAGGGSLLSVRDIERS